jgi:hypothetical protein
VAASSARCGSRLSGQQHRSNRRPACRAQGATGDTGAVGRVSFKVAQGASPVAYSTFSDTEVRVLLRRLPMRGEDSPVRRRRAQQESPLPVAEGEGERV